MRCKVLKELPQGQEPGSILDLPEAVADALLLVGAVERYEPRGEALLRKSLDDESDQDSHELADKSLSSTSSKVRRHYLRRDLKAEP